MIYLIFEKNLFYLINQLNPGSDNFYPALLRLELTTLCKPGLRGVFKKPL
ncbi:MAG: hypothetical protein PHR83_18890 [Paludibacter sp.]|nr:hypothetical protein [Paludibacter sp.]